MSSAPVWRGATAADLDAIMAIQDRVHSLLPEGRETFADKLQLFPEGALVLVRDGVVVGYGFAHPWMLDEAPPLDAILPGLPAAPDCLFIHDVALLPEARGSGAGRAYVAEMSGVARRLGLSRLALVSVYGTVPIWARYGFAVRAVPAMAPKLAGFGDTARYMVANL